LAVYAAAELAAPEDELVLPAETPDTADVVGEVGLVRLGVRRSAEVGYVVHPDSGGQGYATEAVGAVLEYAFEHGGFDRVTARTGEANRRSRVLCERRSMRLDAHE
jgi:aminoglycoside 6'-N-acetyltransferase